MNSVRMVENVRPPITAMPIGCHVSEPAPVPIASGSMPRMVVNEVISTDIAEMLGMKTLARGVRLTPIKDGSVTIECDVVAKFGQSVFSLAKTVQDAVKTSVESITGLAVAQVNVNICGIAMPKELKK